MAIFVECISFRHDTIWSPGLTSDILRAMREPLQAGRADLLCEAYGRGARA